MNLAWESRSRLRISVRLAFTISLMVSGRAALVLGVDVPVVTDPVPFMSSRSLEIPIENIRSGAAPIHGYQLWLTRDGGQSWSRAPGLHRGQGPIAFEAPEDGRYGFAVTPLDLSGRELPSPQAGTPPDVECIVDTVPPHLEILRPRDGDSLYAGTPLVVEWESLDDNPADRPIRIEYRTAADHPWQSVNDDEGEPPIGRYQWWPPVVEGWIEIRIEATDRAGNRTVVAVPHPLRVVPFDGFRGSRALAADPYSAFRKFPVHYRVQEFSPVELATVELWSRHDLGDWVLHEDPDRRSPVIFEATAAEGGLYDFYLRAKDFNGVANRPLPTPDTPPDGRVVVDVHPPEGVLYVGDNEARIFHEAGAPIRARWIIEEDTLPESGVRLEYSLDGGLLWRMLADGLPVTGGQGSFDWRPPLIESESLRLRLRVQDLAGNLALVECPTVIHLMNPRVDRGQFSGQRHRRGLVLAQRGDRGSLRRALEEFDVALRYDPDNTDAWHDRGVVKSQLGEHREALTDFEEAHQRRPAEIPLLFSLIQCRLNLHLLGWDSTGDELTTARRQFAAISKVDIYKSPEFRELLGTYGILKEALDRAGDRP